MADIQFYEGDSDENFDAEDGSLGGSSDGYDSDSSNPDAGLTPLQKLEKYMDSEHSYSRQMVARLLLETLCLVESSSDEVEQVLQAMVRLSDDADGAVRTELAEQIPYIAAHCDENRQLYNSSVSSYLLPIIVRYLTDANNQVRKTGQASLVRLSTQHLITPEEMEMQVAPIILELSEPESIDDFRTEAVMLMTKLSPLVGKDVTERVFLPRFTQLCGDALFHVRKVCAANFGDMCGVVGQQNTEQFLLCKFFALCEDGVWGVRNACAECFQQVSASCSPHIRLSELSQVFITLICDQSRWVRMAAFQALGGFISTFADPHATGLVLSDDGTIVYDGQQIIQEGSVATLAPGDTAERPCKQPEGRNALDTTKNEPMLKRSPKPFEVSPADERRSKYFQYRDGAWVQSPDSNGPVTNDSLSAAEPGVPLVWNFETSPPGRSRIDASSEAIPDEATSTFNSFQFWRIAPSELDTELEIQSAVVSSSSVVISAEAGECSTTAVEKAVCGGAAYEDCHPTGEMKDLTVDMWTVGAVDSSTSAVGLSGTPTPLFSIASSSLSEVLYQTAESGDRTSVSSSHSCFDTTLDYEACAKQTIVPHELLDHYLGMIDPSRAQSVDSEIMRHCAYSLPAVAYTLGRRNWAYLKDLYDILAKDMQWKVRRTLAFSIHELAVILGEEITIRDLLPVFDEFLKDLDEVRIGALKHLADFLMLLSADVRRAYLPKLPEFLNTDNNRNWRFRQELAEQMLLLLDLFSPVDVRDHLSPIVLTLAEDKVAEVRHSAFTVLGGMLRRLSSEEDHFISVFIDEIKERFACSKHWNRRQMFVYLCYFVLEKHDISVELFASTLLASMLSLATDRVPNVRITLARTLRQHVLHDTYLSTIMNPHYPDVTRTLDLLRSDPDRDVRTLMQTNTPNCVCDDTAKMADRPED